MGLEFFSLEALSKTRVGVEFEEALNLIENSLTEDGDIEGERAISLTVSFKPNAAGEKYKTAEMKVTAKTPRRSVKSIATIEDGRLKIDTASNDARQPILYDNDNVTPLKKTAEGGK